MIPVGLTLYLYHVPRAYLMLKDPRAAEKLASLGASSAASGGSASGTTKNGRGASSNINKRAVNSRLMAAGSNERLNKPVQWVSLGNLTPLDQEGGQLATSQESLASVSVDSRTGIMQATSRI